MGFYWLRVILVTLNDNGDIFRQKCLLNSAGKASGPGALLGGISMSGLLSSSIGNGLFNASYCSDVIVGKSTVYYRGKYN